MPRPTVTTAPPRSDERRLPAGPPRHGDLLRVSNYDRVASMLIALLFMVGLIVVALLTIFLTTRVFTLPTPPKVVLVEEERQEEIEEAGGLEEPGMQDVQDLAEPDVKDTLAAVTDAVSTVAASLDAVENVMSTRGSGGAGVRKRGGDTIPRWRRWEIRFQATTLESYAKELEFFGIELAALGGGRAGIDYAYFENGAVRQRATPQADDDRLYFIWQGGKFKEQDRALLGQAGVSTAGRVICQFYPPAVEKQLAALEQQQLGNRPLKEVRRTIFAVRPAGRGYEFFVVEIQWQTGRS